MSARRARKLAPPAALALLLAASASALADEPASATPPPRPAYPYPSQPYPSQPYPSQPYPSQPYPSQPYPPQPYGHPPPYYAPAAPPRATPAPPHEIIPWDPQDPPPEGYELRGRPRTGAIGAGAALLTIGWVTSIVIGVIAAQNETDRGIDGDGVEAGDWAPMYVPVLGPLFAVPSVDARGAGVGLLVADSVLQSAGAALIVYGSLAQNYRVVQTAAARVEVAPLVSLERPGLSVSGVF